MVRDRREAPRPEGDHSIRAIVRERWGTIAAVYAVFVTIAGATALIAMQRRSAGIAVALPSIILWQALVYGFWIPVAMLLHRLLRDAHFPIQAVRRVVPVALIATLVHAMLAVWADREFGVAQAASFGSSFVDRLPIDMLISTAIAAAVAARIAIGRSALLDRALASARQLEFADRRETLLVSAGTSQIPVALPEIESLTAAGNYVVVSWRGRNGMVRGSLRSFEDKLDPRMFARCHRSAIVNLAHVVTASWLADGSWRLELTSGSAILVSRTYRDATLARLGRRR